MYFWSYENTIPGTQEKVSINHDKWAIINFDCTLLAQWEKRCMQNLKDMYLNLPTF